MNHPFDLATLIAADHRLAEALMSRLERGEGDRVSLVAQLYVSLAIHAGAEEQVFYPALRDAGRGSTADEDVAVHQPIKEALATLDRVELDSPEATRALQTIFAAVRAHAPDEEHDQLPWLRRQLGDERMVELGRSFLRHERLAPTHAHPRSPSHPVVTLPTAVVDTLRDKATGRDHLAARDASGRLGPEAQTLIDRLAALTGGKPPHLFSPSEVRKLPTLTHAVKAILAERNAADAPEPVGGVEDRTIPGPAGDLKLRIYRPREAHGGPLPLLVYVHGGGWVLADLDTYDASCRGLCNRAGCLVVSVGYRHAPEAPFPAAHDDVLAATRWVLANAASLGGDPARVAVGGESAGGNMAASTCLALAREGGPQPIFQLLVYPVVSTAMDTPSYTDAADARPLYPQLMGWFFGHAIRDVADLTDPRLDLLGVAPRELAGMPPALVITADRDPLRDEGELFAERLRAAGVRVEATRYDGVMHEFFGATAVLEQAVRAQEQAARALRQAFGTAVATEGPRPSP